MLNLKKASLTKWQDKDNAAHFYRQIDANAWEEVLNGKSYPYKLVFSPLSQTINLLESNNKFYVQLKCGKSTFGSTLSTITDKFEAFGYWTDNSGFDVCSGNILEYVFNFLICSIHFLKSELNYFSFDNNKKAYNDGGYKQSM